MKRCLLVLLLCLLVPLCLLLSCEKTPDNGDGEQNQPDNRPEYTITFVMGPRKITQTYKEGDTITPPTFEPYESSDSFLIFDGWVNGGEFPPVTADATYQAKWTTEYKTYNATFVMGDKTETIKASYNASAVAPKEIPDYKGMSFMCWDKEIKPSTENVTYTALYCDTSMLPVSSLALAYKADLFKYNSIAGNDSGNSLLRRAFAMYTLTLHEHENPQGGAIVKRIVEHMTSIVTKDQAPPIDASTNWAYNPLVASIALARVTPTIWNEIPSDIQLRLNTLMCAMVYLGSFSTSDYNGYKTGPGMGGNYSKDWNPNYRLGNIPTMVYATYFFGVGDIDAGAQTVNSLIKGFNESVYTDLVNTFQKYGWRRAFKTWTSEARTATDGTGVKGMDAKTLLCYGGQAVGEDTSTASDLLVALGTGSGVANLDSKGKPRDYLYKTFSLYEPEKIVQHLINYNYGGKSIPSGSYESVSGYLEVKSDHWYDIDGDGVKNLVAWIMDNTSSPYEGEEGMMTEFASGNRSSTGYCTHDIILTTTLITACRAMEKYTTDENGKRVPMTDEEGNPVYVFDITAPENEAIFHRVQVGNEDLIYKLIHGYQCYATGSYGTSSKVEYEGSSAEYIICKTLWRTSLLSKGTVLPAESYSTEE